MKLLLVTNINFNAQASRLVAQARSLDWEVALVQVGSPAQDLGSSSELFSFVKFAFKASSKKRRSLGERAMFSKAMLTATQRFKPDVIWCLCLWDVSLAAALLGYLLGIPVVTSVCGSDFYGHKGKILSRIRMKITCELSQLVATTSVKFREDVGNALQIKEKKQMTKHWGIKDNIFNLSKRPTATQGIKKELHIDLGRILRDISFYKETLCALAKLKNSGVCFKATALMAGVQDYVVEDFKNIVQELDLSDSVAVWPVIRDEVGLAAYFGSCDIALNMIQRDQLGSSLLEALACGACLISTALPQYMELSSCGIQYLCVPIKPSADDIFKAITYARSSNLMSVAVQNKNFMLVRRHYSFESNTQTMFQAFRSVAGSKNLILKAL